MSNEGHNNSDFTRAIIDNAPENISVSVATKDQLHQVYLPFVKNGGIFIATTQQYQLGDKLTLNLSLLDEVTTVTVETQVVWLNPACAQEGLPQGVGVQFDEKEGKVIRTMIENHLAGYSGSNTITHTM